MGSLFRQPTIFSSAVKINKDKIAVASGATGENLGTIDENKKNDSFSSDDSGDGLQTDEEMKDYNPFPSTDQAAPMVL
jgi:hypothetical protein